MIEEKINSLFKGCTKPNCDCVEIAEQKNGGNPVKSYPCLHSGFDGDQEKSPIKEEKEVPKLYEAVGDFCHDDFRADDLQPVDANKEVLYSEQEIKLIATRFARQSRMMHDVTSNDTITSYENWFKPENFKSQSVESIVGFKFDEEESSIIIDELKKLSDIYETLQSKFGYLSYDTVEYLSKPIRDLLLHNGVNVDDDTNI